MAVSREVVWRIRTAFEDAGLKAAEEGEQRLHGATNRANVAFNAQRGQVIGLDTSKRRLITTGVGVASNFARVAMAGGNLSGVLSGAVSTVGMLARGLGGLAGPIGIALLLGTTVVQALDLFGSKTDDAADKTDRLQKELDEAKTSVEKARAAFTAGLFSTEQLADIEAYARSLEKQRDAVKPSEEIAKAVQRQVDFARELAPLQANLENLRRQEKIAQDDVAFGDKRRVADLAKIQAAVQAVTTDIERQRVRQRDAEDSSQKQLRSRIALQSRTKNLTEEELKLFSEGAAALDAAVRESAAKRLASGEETTKAEVAAQAAYFEFVKGVNRELIASDADTFRARRELAEREFLDKQAILQKHIDAGRATAEDLVLLEALKAAKIRKINEDEAAQKIALSQAAAQSQAAILGNLAATVGAFAGEEFFAVKALRLAEAVMNTAAGVTAALARADYLGAGVIATAGAAQVAAILKTTLGGGGASAPSFAGGGAAGGGGEFGAPAGAAPALGAPPPAAIAAGPAGGLGIGTVNIHLDATFQVLDLEHIPEASLRRITRRLAVKLAHEINAVGNSMRR